MGLVGLVANAHPDTEHCAMHGKQPVPRHIMPQEDVARQLIKENPV
jgi:hypothetical protein